MNLEEISNWAMGWKSSKRECGSPLTYLLSVANAFIVNVDRAISVNLVYNFGSRLYDHTGLDCARSSSNSRFIPYAHAALLEPLVTVVHGWHKVAINAGETVAILGGGGPISLMFIQLLLRAGAAQVIAVGHSPARLELEGWVPVILSTPTSRIQSRRSGN